MLEVITSECELLFNENLLINDWNITQHYPIQKQFQEEGDRENNFKSGSDNVNRPLAKASK